MVMVLPAGWIEPGTVRNNAGYYLPTTQWGKSGGIHMGNICMYVLCTVRYVYIYPIHTSFCIGSGHHLYSDMVGREISATMVVCLFVSFDVVYGWWYC